MSKKAPDKLSQLRATQRSAMQKLSNPDLNQGPVDTPSEIRAQYYNPYVTIKSAGQIDVQTNNPGPIDSPAEIAAHKSPEQKAHKNAIQELKKTSEQPNPSKKEDHNKEEESEIDKKFRPT